MTSAFTETESVESDDISAHPARPRVALIATGLLLCETLAFIKTFGIPPHFELTLDQVMGSCVLVGVGPLTILAFVGAFSPYPLLKISHGGIRTYSIFGTFGTELTPWSHIKSIVIYHRLGQCVLKIYGDFQSLPTHRRLTRRLLRHEKEILRAELASGSVSGSLDEIFSEIKRRFGREIEENAVAFIDQDASQHAQ